MGSTVLDPASKSIGVLSQASVVAFQTELKRAVRVLEGLALGCPLRQRQPAVRGLARRRSELWRLGQYGKVKARLTQA